MRKEHAGKVAPSMVMDMTGCDGTGYDTTAKMKGMISHTQLVAEVNPSVRDTSRAVHARTSADTSSNCFTHFRGLTSNSLGMAFCVLFFNVMGEQKHSRLDSATWALAHGVSWEAATIRNSQR